MRSFGVSGTVSVVDLKSQILPSDHQIVGLLISTIRKR